MFWELGKNIVDELDHGIVPGYGNEYFKKALCIGKEEEAVLKIMKSRILDTGHISS